VREIALVISQREKIGFLHLMDGQNSWKEISFHLEKLQISWLFPMIDCCRAHL